LYPNALISTFDSCWISVLESAIERERLPIFAYAVMPNHWHFVVGPKTKSQLSDFFRWLTHTHTMRWHAHYHTEGHGGHGHLYQGQFKTFPIEGDHHLLTVLRYVERNPLQAAMCERAEDFRRQNRRSCGARKWRRQKQRLSATVSDYLRAAPKEAQEHLREIRSLLKKVAPEATENIKWGSPVLEEVRVHGS